MHDLDLVLNDPLASTTIRLDVILITDPEDPDESTIKLPPIYIKGTSYETEDGQIEPDIIEIISRSPMLPVFNPPPQGVIDRSIQPGDGGTATLVYQVIKGRVYLSDYRTKYKPD